MCCLQDRNAIAGDGVAVRCYDDAVDGARPMAFGGLRHFRACLAGADDDGSTDRGRRQKLGETVLRVG